ncbi:hypothetical protein Gotur_022551 [Gossypium turneri]
MGFVGKIMRMCCMYSEIALLLELFGINSSQKTDSLGFALVPSLFG